MQFPLVHVSWSLADNAQRRACDAFFREVFGARTAHEILITPETEKMGLDREESLLMIGDTMVIPIAPAGRGAQEGHPLGDMLRRAAAPHRWLGVALQVRDLAEADAWFAARGFGGITIRAWNPSISSSRADRSWGCGWRSCGRTCREIRAAFRHGDRRPVIRSG